MQQFVFILLFLGGSALQSMVNGQESLSKIPGNGTFENILLYTDRDIYFSGERVWFKVLCYGPGGQAETVLSKIICVEIYDQQFNSITKGKFRIINGTATGFLGIPSSINSGNYYLRAYSQFLRNYPPYLYPTSFVSIINPDKPLPESENVLSEEIEIVPEGGKIVAGIASKLAVRINPALCKDISGMAVVDLNGREIAQIMPFPNGLAMFEIMPDSGARYSIKITRHDSRIIQKSLPPVSEDGMILKSEYTGSKLKITLCRGKKTGSTLPTSYKITIKSETFNDLININIDPDETIEIPGDQLTNGMVYLLLRNNDNEIINIQSDYISGLSKKQISIIKNQAVYHPRELVHLKTGMQENNMNNNYSLLSVTMASTLNNHKNLLPQYISYNPALLSNYIKSSAPETDSIKKQIDIVLNLYSAVFNTRDFKENMEHERILEWLPEIRDAHISGQIINKKTKKPLENVMVYAAVIRNNNQLHMYRTDASGRFFFTLNHLADMHHVYICPRPIDSLEMEMKINTDFSNAYPQSAGIIPFHPDSSEKRLLDQLYLNAQVSNTFIRHAEHSIENPGYYPLSTPAPDYSIMLKEFIEMPVMAEVFTEITPYVSMRKRDDRYYLNVYDDKAFTTYTDPLVLLDGIPVFDLNQIMKISPEDVEKIEVTNKVIYLGDYSIEGLISIKTPTRNFAGIAFPDASEFIEYQAVTTESYPVFPDHTASERTDRNPDFRNLLYWNPFLLPESQSNDIRFYTSDQCGRFEIVFRAFDGLTHYYGTEILEVEK